MAEVDCSSNENRFGADSTKILTQPSWKLCNDIQYSCIQHSDTQHNSALYRVLLCWVSMLNVIYAECHLCWVSFMLNVIYAECHLCWMPFMLNAIYTEWHLCWMSFMLSVTNKPFMLIVVMLNVITLNVVAPLKVPWYPASRHSVKFHST